MTKVNLTKCTRKQIVDKILEYTFRDKYIHFAKEETTLFQKCYEYIIDEKYRNLMESLPQNYFHSCADLHVNVAGMALTLTNFDVSKIEKNLKNIKLKIYPGGQGHIGAPAIELVKHVIMPVFIARGVYADRPVIDGVIATAVNKHVFAKEDLKIEVCKLHSELNGIINSMRTTDKVEEAFPFTRDICPDLLGAKPTTALVASTEKVLCKIAQIREEERDGCCNGVPIKQSEEV